MNVQHCDVKVPFAGTELPDLEALIPVFHRWVRERVFGDLLIDVADYRHVPNGPGILAIGHEGNYSFDLTGGIPGVRYVRKARVEGDTAAALTQALTAVAAAGKLLEDDPALGGAFKFDWRSVEVRINDRLLAPNRPETFTRLEPELSQYFQAAAAPGEVRIEHQGEPRELFCVTVRLSAPLNLGVVRSS